MPGGLYYSGWDGNDPIPNSNVFGVHHPKGSHKRITFGYTRALDGICPTNIICENYIAMAFTSGIIEKGSSGSGLFYDDGNERRLIGNLTGGESQLCNQTGPLAYLGYYGKFSLTYHKISSYIADNNCTYGISPSSNNFTAAGGRSGFSIATDGACYQSAVVTSPNTVQTYSNSAPISIADRAGPTSPPGLGSLYPSTINVSGLLGTVTRVRVILNGLTHTYPDDLDLLLVGPNGQSALLMSDAGDSSDVNNENLTIDQSGRILLPDTSTLTSGVFRPSNYASLNIAESDGAETFPNPAPGRNIYENSLGFFYGINPNGTWKLYVVDDEAGDVGAINGGWNLEIATTSNSWLTVDSGGVGYGNNTVNYSVAPNNTAQPRTGIINVGGQNFTVTQNAGTNCSPPPPLPLRQTVQGNLQNGDCFYTDGSLYDAYTFNGTAGQQIYITLNSTQFNAYLFLFQGSYPSGNLLAQNNDGGGGTNARIPATSGFFTLPATGTYTVLANSLSVGETGSYTLFLDTNAQPSGKKLFDFDGDGKTDYGVFRPANGVWYLQNSTNGFLGQQFGISTDRLVPADYDGDGRTDIAVFRNGIWYLLQSSQGFLGIQFGITTDIPQPFDYDGDGKADIAVFRPSNGTWYLLRSRDGFAGIQFGINGDKPVAADYDGDGRDDIAVVRQSGGASNWYILRSNQGFYAIQFGIQTDRLVPADYDGDGKADIAVYRNGIWYILRSQLGFAAIQFGIAEDRTVAGDYDGDGKADVAVWRPSSGTFYALRSQQGFTGLNFGISSDSPIASAYIP